VTSYIRNIIIVGVAASLAVSALPKNSSESGKYVKYLASFLILVTLLSPVKELLHNLSDVKEVFSGSFEEAVTEEENTSDPVIEKTAETIAKYVLSICRSKFGVDTENARVKVILDDTDKENVVIKELQIYTSEKDREVLNDIEKHFSKMLEADVFAFGP